MRHTYYSHVSGVEGVEVVLSETLGAVVLWTLRVVSECFSLNSIARCFEAVFEGTLGGAVTARLCDEESESGGWQLVEEVHTSRPGSRLCFGIALAYRYTTLPMKQAAALRTSMKLT